MNLSYSTLACPDWTVEQAAAAARAFDYDGLELRMLDRDVITPELLRAEAARLGQALRGLSIASLGTSIWLALDGPEWLAQFEEYCAIAAELQVPIVRVWGGRYTADLGRDAAVALIAGRLDTAAGIAAAYGVRVALATHDHFSSLAAVEDVFDLVTHPSVGIVWDVHNTFTEGGTSPEQVWDALGDRINQVHVKDARKLSGADGSWAPTLLGDGEVPVREAMRLLRRVGFDGWVSVNWPKLRSPELAEPDVMLPQYAQLLRLWYSETN